MEGFPTFLVSLSFFFPKLHSTCCLDAEVHLLEKIVNWFVYPAKPLGGLADALTNFVKSFHQASCGVHV